MNPTQGRSPADETQVNPQDKKQAGGGKGATRGPNPQPGTATEQTCANCGMKQDEWRTPKGYQQDSETFCCEGCATGTGCTC
jgi:hypothetical protein